jgi:hypothetical protein
MSRAGRWSGCAVLALVVAACGHKEQDNASSLGPVHVDTANTDPRDGVSDAQLKEQAQALTPEQAAARGMVDTTTHIEDLGGSDTTPAGAANNDTVAGRVPPAAATTPTRP